MRTLVISLSLALAFLAAPPAEAATKKATGGQASSSSCPCSGSKLCVGPKGGKFCIAPNGKKRYQK